MSTDPWGVDTPPSVPPTVPPLPTALAELAALVARGGRRILEAGEQWAFPRATDLPEVQALVAEGWRVAPGDPMSRCLPAVWPAEHRCWVPDRLPRISHASGGGRSWLQPWDEDDLAEAAAEAARAAADCGLPSPPPGRLWLLRSPWLTLGLEVLLALMRRRRAERHLDEDVRGTTDATRELLSWREDAVWAWWQGPDADAAREWRVVGRVGEDVAGLVLAGLNPTLTGRLVAPATDGGAGLTEAQVVAWAEAVAKGGEDAVESIVAWRRQGQPADPPADHSRSMVMSTMTAPEVGEWLAAGFTFEEVAAWRGADLGLALRWRENGFTGAQARELLSADRAVTPQEALAFDDAGIDTPACVRWLEVGFSAAEARAWTELDVLPQEARVWRSLGKDPDDAREHLAAGGGPLPPDTRVGWFGYGSARHQRQYGVADPPGTRGSLAAQGERRPRR